MHRYAWLEHEGGEWHFLTSLFANTGESTRKWADERHALDELRDEGWIVIRPYPEKPLTARQSGDCLFGYGLVRTVH